MVLRQKTETSNGSFITSILVTPQNRNGGKEVDVLFSNYSEDQDFGLNFT